MCYAQSLACEETIYKRAIKSKTIKGYLLAASKLRTGIGLMDPRKDNHGNMSPLIDAVIKEQRRWESMPNRKDPFTKEMLLHVHLTAEKDPDSLSSAIADWFTLGLLTGFCKSEWAQEASERSSTGYKLAPDGSSLAITPNNMALFGLHRAHLCTGADITTGIATGIPHETSITWRFQKIWTTDRHCILVVTMHNHTCAHPAPA